MVTGILATLLLCHCIGASSFILLINLRHNGRTLNVSDTWYFTGIVEMLNMPMLDVSRFCGSYIERLKWLFPTVLSGRREGKIPTLLWNWFAEVEPQQCVLIIGKFLLCLKSNEVALVELNDKIFNTGFGNNPTNPHQALLARQGSLFRVREHRGCNSLAPLVHRRRNMTPSGRNVDIQQF